MEDYNNNLCQVNLLEATVKYVICEHCVVVSCTVLRISKRSHIRLITTQPSYYVLVADHDVHSDVRQCINTYMSVISTPKDSPPHLFAPVGYSPVTRAFQCVAVYYLENKNTNPGQKV